MKDIAWMNRYWKEVWEVSTWKYDIKDSVSLQYQIWPFMGSSVVVLLGNLNGDKGNEIVHNVKFSNHNSPLSLPTASAIDVLIDIFKNSSLWWGSQSGGIYASIPSNSLITATRFEGLLNKVKLFFYSQHNSQSLTIIFVDWTQLLE